MGIGGVMAGPLAVGTEDCKGETASSRGSGSIGSKSDSKADSAMGPRVLLRLGDAMGSRAGSGSVTGSGTPRFPPFSAAVGAAEAASAVSGWDGSVDAGRSVDDEAEAMGEGEGLRE